MKTSSYPLTSDTYDVLQGHVLDVLPGMEPESVHCCATSPPYWGLRKYNGEQEQVWLNHDGTTDGENCEHEWGRELLGDTRGGSGPGAKEAYTDGGVSSTYGRKEPRGAFCRKCGAWRGALGLEPTPELYVEHLVEVFRAVRRVLRPEGTLWLNLGDCYATGSHDSLSFRRDRAAINPQCRPRPAGLKPKDLVGMPWRVAFALQADGWWLRCAPVWAKALSFCKWKGTTLFEDIQTEESFSGSVMPESAPDRPTSAYEMVFLLTKSERCFYDHFAAQESSAGINEHDLTGCGYAPPGQSPQRGNRSLRGSGNKERKQISIGGQGHSVPWENGGTRNWRNVWVIQPEPFDTEYCRACRRVYSRKAYGRLQQVCPECRTPGVRKQVLVNGKLRWRRVPDCECDAGLRGLCKCGEVNWLSHFATFPTELPEKCIIAGTSPKACGRCGAPYERVIEREKHPSRDMESQRCRAAAQTGRTDGAVPGPSGMQDRTEQVGWRPTCECLTAAGSREQVAGSDDATGHLPSATGRSVVLDPFCGTGRTGLAAKRLGRDFIGIDISEEYCDMAGKLLGAAVTEPLFV